MFVLVTLKDTIRIPPNKFDVPMKQALTDEINERLANKVIVDVGLCITFYDIVKLGESFLFQGDGASHTVVTFRYIVFRPFVGETILGKIKSSTREGIRVTLGFFEDILITESLLQEPKRFDEREQLWVWEYKDDETGEKHDMVMEPNEKIRFKVKQEIFEDTSPTGPSNQQQQQSGSSSDGPRRVPYSIIGSIAEPGLGLLSWWK